MNFVCECEDDSGMIAACFAHRVINAPQLITTCHNVVFSQRNLHCLFQFVAVLDQSPTVCRMVVKLQ